MHAAGVSYFIFNTATLIDAAKTTQDLTPCITTALAASRHLRARRVDIVRGAT